MNILFLALNIVFWLLSLLILFPYLIHPLVLLAIHPRRKLRLRKDKGYLPTVSLIIAIYNEERILKERLANLRQLDYPADKLEIIFGLDGCSDDSARVIYSARDSRIRLLEFPQNRGKLATLADCLRQANGELIYFSDANTIQNPAAVREMAAPFADHRVGVVCGRLDIVPAGSGTESRGENLYWRYEQKIKKLEGDMGVLVGANGGNYGFRRKLFPKIPSGMITEDFYLPMVICSNGYSCVYQEKSVGVEETSQRMRDQMRRMFRIGVGNYQALFKLGYLLSPRYGLLAYAFFGHKVLRWVAPVFLGLAFASSAVLGFCYHSLFYQILFYIQSGFYLLSLVGGFLQLAKVRAGVLGLPFYFSAINFSLVVGFFRFLFGTQKPAWGKEGRADK
jgi:cellulose synthase/poly-beta-1,6-N-acetylglucosamine synthase-like glycosyltransferase